MATRATAKSELFGQWKQGNLVVADEGKSTGARFWVSSVTGNDSSGYGSSPDAPFASLAYAFSSDLLTASKGDVVYVMPGHAETIDAAGDIAMDIAGVHVIGLGGGASRPTFTFSTSTAATITISAAGITLENLLFVHNINALVSAIVISGTDCSIINCEMRDSSATVEAAIGILTEATADRLLIDGLNYRGYITGDAATNALCLIGVDGGIIRNSVFYGEFSTAVIEFLTTASTNITIDNCYFYNDNVALTKDIVNTGGLANTWQAFDCFDGKGGYGFSGGSAAALAIDDISTVSSIATTTSAGVSTADSKVVSVATVAGATSAGVSTADSKVVSVATVVGNASAGVSTADSKVVSVATVVGNTSAGVSTADSKVVSVATVVGNTSAGVSTADSKVVSVATVVGNTSAGVSTADSRVVSIATVVGNTSAGVSTADSKVVSMATVISDGVSTADSKVVSVATIVGNTSAGVSTADSKVVSVATVVGNTSAGVSTADSRVVSVATVVGNASAGISTADSKVVSVATVVGNTSTGVSTVSSIATVLDAWDVRTISKAAIALDGGTVNNVFTVANGPVIIEGLILLITTAVSANNCTMKWQNDPDLAVAATTDLCGTVDLISAAIGDMFATVGASASAAVKYASGTATGLMNTVGAIAQAGAINLVLANADPTTGAGTAYLIYRPLSSTATVTAP